MSDPPSQQRYSLAEEVVHALTHGFGLLLSVVGLAALLSIALASGGASRVLAATVFGMSLIVTYGISTLYHLVPMPRLKRVLQVLDHSSIYLLIAGTYTPFAVLVLRGAWGWSLLVVIWALAACGVMFKLLAMGRFPYVSITLYLVMGWLGLVAIGPLVQSLQPGGLVLLVLGGVAYTGGVLFFAWERLPFHHAIWHLFVLIGSGLHFFSVLLYVLPAAA